MFGNVANGIRRMFKRMTGDDVARLKAASLAAAMAAAGTQDDGVEGRRRTKRSSSKNQKGAFGRMQTSRIARGEPLTLIDPRPALRPAQMREQTVGKAVVRIATSRWLHKVCGLKWYGPKGV
jgi:hypothetical protein